MQDLSASKLLMIEPKSKKAEPKIDDKYTAMAQLVLDSAKTGKAYRGWHTCSCGAHSGSKDLIYKSYTTNSLALHYTQEHRSEVPQSELDKLDKLFPELEFSDKVSVVKGRSKP